MDLTQESFDRLLSWLHPVPDEAGMIYVKIRSDLIRNFTSHGCSVSDELADITIDRVAQKLPTIIDTYVGERQPYFRRVAFYVLKEYQAKAVPETELPPDLPDREPDHDEDIESYSHCLDKCIDGLPKAKQYLIRKYYRGDKGAKIRQRKELAAELKLELAALRVKALRIRRELRGCTHRCLAALRLSDNAQLRRTSRASTTRNIKA